MHSRARARARALTSCCAQGTLIVSVWVTGSVITVISEQVILGLAHSLLTKLVTTPMQSMWAGLIMSMQALTNGVAFAWVDHDPNVEYLPSEITMGLVGAALLIMIPVYRRLVPQLFSPWSGAQLPVQVDRVRALHEKLSDDSPSPHVPKLLSMAVAAPIASIGAPRGVGSPRGQSSVPGSALSQFRGSRTPSTFAVNLDPLSASASSGAPTVTFPSDTSTASNQTASRRQGSVASSYAAGLGTSHQRPLSSAAGTGVPLVPSTNFDDLD